MRWILLLLLAACSGKAPAPSEAVVVSPGAVGDSIGEFTAKNFTGETRTRADLVGKPTVVWFYPMAGSPG